MKSLQLACVLSLCMAPFVSAQGIPDIPQPTPQHKWLKKFVGQWEVVGKGVMAEGQPPIESKATISSAMVGGFWVTNAMQGTAAGMRFQGLQTIGYDPAKKKYVGTWIDSMNAHMWKYTGTVNDSATKIILDAEGPDMADPTKTRKYRDTYEFKGADLMVATSSMLMDDGTWYQFMTSTGKRMKKPGKKRPQSGATDK